MEPSRDLRISGRGFLMISNKYLRFHQFHTVTGSSNSLWTLRSLEKRFEKRLCEKRLSEKRLSDRKLFERRLFKKRLRKRGSLGTGTRGHCCFKSSQ